MYNKKEDTRSARSMMALRDALMICLKSKKFHDITISDLSRTAHVSRVTFYRFFSNTTDVLEYLCDSFFLDAIRDYKNIQRDDSDEYFIHLFKYILQRSDFVDAAFRSRRIDIFQKSFSNYVDMYVPKIQRHFSPWEAEYIKMSFSAVFVSIVFVWEKHGKVETAEELFRIFKKVSSEM